MDDERRVMRAPLSITQVVQRVSLLIILVIVVIYFLTGIFQVEPSEVGLVMTFGKHTRTVEPGINYRLPFPFESVIKVDVRSIRKVEIGFRTAAPGRFIVARDEALMMTGDNNFASVEAVVQYRVNNPEFYAFHIADPNTMIRFICESVIRERVAQRTINQVLTIERDMIAQESKERIQDILNSLESGIWVENVNLQEVNPPAQVLAAFDDVNSSLQDKERIINTAMRYYNDVVPRSQGEASRILQQAEGYMEVQILKAEGDVVRFEMILDEYEKSPEITKERLYIEMMESILPNARKLVLSGADNGLLKLLNIQELLGGGGL